METECYHTAYRQGWVDAERAVDARVRKLVGDWQANGNGAELGDPTASTWHACARQLLDALEGR